MQILCTVIPVNLPCGVGALQRHAYLTPSEPSVVPKHAAIVLLL